VLAGSGSGANGALFGFNNLLFGTSTPQIQNGGKWVVDSPGIRDSFNFMKQVYSGGLGAQQSVLFSPSGAVAPTMLFSQHKLAIAIGPNFYAGEWTKFVSAPYWPQAPTVMGVAPMPSQNGGKTVSALGGLDFAMSAHSGNPKAAWKLIDIMENKQNAIDAANWAGFVTPNSDYWDASAYSSFAPPFNAQFAHVLSSATITPSASNYSIWVQGLGNATGQIVQNPATSVDAAVNTLSSYVSNQLGSGATQKLP
jgi:multiple sugar transport system substrate-binding protein